MTWYLGKHRDKFTFTCFKAEVLVMLSVDFRSVCLFSYKVICTILSIICAMFCVVVAYSHTVGHAVLVLKPDVFRGCSRCIDCYKAVRHHKIYIKFHCINCFIPVVVMMC